MRYRRRVRLERTSRYCGLQRSASLIRCALSDSMVAITELELDNIADRRSNNVGDICILRPSDYDRYNLVGPLDFRVDIAANYTGKLSIQCPGLTCP